MLLFYLYRYHIHICRIPIILLIFNISLSEKVAIEISRIFCEKTHYQNITFRISYIVGMGFFFNVIGTIWRPTGLSFIYLGLMLYSPMVPIPNKTMTGHTEIYLKICICLAFLVVITQITFHIVLLSLPPYGYFLQNCKQHLHLNVLQLLFS